MDIYITIFLIIVCLCATSLIGMASTKLNTPLDRFFTWLLRISGAAAILFVIIVIIKFFAVAAL